MGRYTSEILYHMVGSASPGNDDNNFQTLRKILRCMEIWTNSVAGKRGLMMTRTDPARSITKGEPIEQTVTCFCDIPREALSLHVTKFGRFGVGIDRAEATALGARPVIYLPTLPRNPLLMINGLAERFMQGAKDLDQFFPGPDGESYSSRTVGAPATDAQDAADVAQDLLVRDVLAFVKMFGADLPEDHPQNYYMEREWRKFGNMPLGRTLREVVAPVEYHEQLRCEFPGLAGVAMNQVA